jgi:hypothetical protein
MFGHQDQESQNSTNSNPDPVASATTAPDYSNQMSQFSNNSPSSDNSLTDTTPTLASEGNQTTDPAISSVSSNITPNSEALSPAGGYPKNASEKIKSNDDSDTDDFNFEDIPSTPVVTGNHNQDLTAIKQQVITELSPLIDKLDQTPQDRFRTLMMMIQATDNQTLIEAAYEAAHNIDDEKNKAQALLDILNEINYFTQPHNSSN